MIHLTLLSAMVSTFFIFTGYLWCIPITVVLLLSLWFRRVPGDGYRTSRDFISFYGEHLSEYRNRRQLFALVSLGFASFITWSFVQRCIELDKLRRVLYPIEIFSCIFIGLIILGGTILLCDNMAASHIARNLLPGDLQEKNKDKPFPWCNCGGY